MFERKIRTKNLYIAELVRVVNHENHRFEYQPLSPKSYVLVKPKKKNNHTYKDVLNKSEYFLCNCYLSYPGAIAIGEMKPFLGSTTKIKYSDAQKQIKYLNTKIKK